MFVAATLGCTSVVTLEGCICVSVVTFFTSGLAVAVILAACCWELLIFDAIGCVVGDVTLAVFG